MAATRDAELLESRPAFRGRVLDLRVDRVRMPNGRQAELEVVRHPGAAAVVALTSDRQVLLLRQFRYATGDWLLEVPAGKLDGGEEPEACARRELEEESGFRAGRLRPLGWIWTSPGFTDEKIWLFLATGLEPSRQSLQSDEVLSVEKLPFDEAVRRAASGEIRDAKSICALFRAAGLLGRDEPAV